jgi:hypothetical protein
MSFVLPGDPRRTGEPWLVWDDRPALEAKNTPGMHALLCGVLGPRPLANQLRLDGAAKEIPMPQ